MQLAKENFPFGAFKGAVFDLDGTLIDSMSYWDHAAAGYLLSIGIVPRPGMADEIRAMNLSQAAEFLIRNYGVKKTVEEMVAEVNLQIADFYCNKVPAKPGAVAFVRRIHEAGVPLKLLTASNQKLADGALRHIGIRDCFTFVESCSVGIGKDNPECFLKAAECFHASPPEIVVFEDAFYAVKSAKQCGFTVIAVADPAAADTKSGILRLADGYWETF